MIPFMYWMPTRLLFGPGQLERLSEEKLPGKRALLVMTAGGSMRRYGYLERVERLLAQQTVETVIFDQVTTNPTERCVTAGAALARREGCDFVIGLGGGSSMDAGKAISLMVGNEGNYWMYCSGITGGRQAPSCAALPFVAIPTTAGTGSEVDSCAVITREETHEKCGLRLDALYPILTIADSTLTYSIPPLLTAFQGFDALSHAMESLMSTVPSAIGDEYARQAIRLLAENLPKVVADGSCSEARDRVMYASTLAGLVMRCVSPHAMEHALSAYHPELPHGAGLLMLCLPYYRRQMMKPNAEKRCREISALLQPGCDNLIEALQNLMQVCNVQHLSVREYGISPEERSILVQNARLCMTKTLKNDCEPLTEEEMEDIFTEACEA